MGLTPCNALTYSICLQAESLGEQLELFKEELTNKTEEVLQLNMQLEIQRKQSEQAVQQAQEEYLLLKASALLRSQESPVLD